MTDPLAREAADRFARSLDPAAGEAERAALGAWLVLPAGWLADFGTGAGERRTVDLPDGSAAELSTSTALSVAFDGDLRHAHLHRGEAFLHVVEDARPFSIQAAGGRTTALEADVAVAMAAEGVRVAVQKRAAMVAVGRDRVVVEAGRRVRYDERLGPVEAADLAVDLAWREGRLVFHAVPFGRVVAELDRWRPGRTIVMDEALARRLVTVIVDVRRSDAIVAALPRMLPVRLVTLSRYLTLVYPAA